MARKTSTTATRSQSSKFTSTTTTGSVAINTPINNSLVTVSSTGTQLNSERVLTFDGNKLSVQAGMVYKRREMTSGTTLTASDYYIACKITSSSTLVLPSSTTLASGQTFVIKDESGSLSDSVVLSLSASGSETIEDVATFSITQANASIFVYTDAAGKYFIY
mgnify:FL=1